MTRRRGGVFSKPSVGFIYDSWVPTVCVIICCLSPLVHTGRSPSFLPSITLIAPKDGQRHQPFRSVGLRTQRRHEEVDNRTARAQGNSRTSCLFRHQSHKAASEEDGHPLDSIPRIALSSEFPRSVRLIMTGYSNHNNFQGSAGFYANANC